MSLLSLTGALKSVSEALDFFHSRLDIMRCYFENEQRWAGWGTVRSKSVESALISRRFLYLGFM